MTIIRPDIDVVARELCRLIEDDPDRVTPAGHPAFHERRADAKRIVWRLTNNRKARAIVERKRQQEAANAP